MHGFIMACLCMLSWLSLTVNAPAAPRNIVLMIGDDHGLQAGCYGDKVIKTPSLDRLAAQGTRFANAFGSVSSCSASRSVILSGMHNHTNGQYGLAHADHNFHSFETVRSLPNLLKDAGYRTAIIGKYHVLPTEAYQFDQRLEYSSGRNVVEMTKAAKAYIAADASKPFFLLVGYYDPHRAGEGFTNQQPYPGVKKTVYNPADIVVPPWLPDAPDTRADLADYYQAISRMDQGIGEVLDAIEATGHRDDTLLVYVSDNGPPFPGAKTTLYDPGIHLPLIVALPGQKRASVVNKAMVSFVDIAPTILEWAGVQPPTEMAGRSLVPILEQDDPTGWDTVYGSHSFHEVTMYYPMRMIRTREYKYILNLAHPLEYPFASDLWGSRTWQAFMKSGAARYGERAVAAFLHRPKGELYDLKKDPGELHNLAGDNQHADVLNDLRKRLREWQEKTKDPWVIKYKHE